MTTWDEMTPEQQRNFATMMGHVAQTLLDYGNDLGLDEAVPDGDAGMAFVRLGMAQYAGVFPHVHLGAGT
jgi:hypothetical protein